MELRLDLHTSVRDIKTKLTTHNGTPADSMVLQLQDADGTVLAVLDDDSRPLGFYSVRNGQTLHCIDTDPLSLSRDGGLDDVSRIQKYRMTEEEYDKRGNTLRAYKRKMQEKDPNFRLVPRGPLGGAPTQPAESYEDAACVQGISVGARCEVAPGARRGTVAFLGPVGSLAIGYWVGVRLDEPLGKGDGSRGGITLFECPDRYGAFVRPNFVTLGDFPEAGMDGDDDDAEIAALMAASSTASGDSGTAGAGAAATGTGDCGHSAPDNAAADAPAAGQPPAGSPLSAGGNGSQAKKVAVSASARRRGQESDGDSDNEL